MDVCGKFAIHSSQGLYPTVLACVPVDVFPCFSLFSVDFRPWARFSPVMMIMWSVRNGACVRQIVVGNLMNSVCLINSGGACEMECVSGI